MVVTQHFLLSHLLVVDLVLLQVHTTIQEAVDLVVVCKMDTREQQELLVKDLLVLVAAAVVAQWVAEAALVELAD
jgi:hypothetical protein